MSDYDLLITNVKVIGANAEPFHGDIAVKDGAVASLGAGIDSQRAERVVDGQGKLAFPGAVDAHQHWGIYNELREDAASESRASAQGGVTTGITYMRTGQYYLNQSGPYKEFMPKVLEASDGQAHIDYTFHVAPMSKEHISELPVLAKDFGITSFKIFMFYGGFGLHGASSSQRDFLMLPEGENYDIAHFEAVMRGVQKLRDELPEYDDEISLGLHCETAEIMRAYTQMVRDEGELTGLEAYSAARPPHSEGLAITIASYLAHETQLPTINLLHLSSAKALEAAVLMGRTFPHVNFRREVTIGHLLASYDSAANIGGKVNPPLRSQDDIEALWQHLAAGDVDWVVSDHACCSEEDKFGRGEDKDDVFAAKSGFGGAEYLLPGLVGEGLKRGVSEQRIAQLLSWNPAQRFGLTKKGDIAIGYDADIALVDTTKTTVIAPEDSVSTQEYTPFEGFTLEAAVTDTFVRGNHVLHEGELADEAIGRFIPRGPGAN